MRGACNAQHFCFASQEHDTPDYFQIILQTPWNTMGHALNVGCNRGGISAVKHYPHVTQVWIACVGHDWLVLWWGFLNFVMRQMQCYFCY